ARLQRFLLYAFQIGRILTNVGHERHHFTTTVVLFQPGNDGRGIQTARVSQNDLFDVLRAHVVILDYARIRVPIDTPLKRVGSCS
ncbi:hypothetical protein N7568_24555, partial [Paenarthrobacter aurescens]|nr:hypothetical protein [Paenarthrobacter aurescens]